MGLIDAYTYVIDDLGDPRVKNWFLMDGLLPLTTVIIIYLYIVRIGGVKFMENRKPFNLKRVIQLYNIYQVISCMSLIYLILTNGWIQKKITIYCCPIDYSDDPMSMRIAELLWWTMMLKLSEFIETIFFLLRKKYNQISNLHLYHHASTLLFIWIGVKYFAGGMTTFSVILNSFVHIIMYTYYFLSTLGPEWQKKLSKLKNKLTMIQMIQFGILVVHSCQVFNPDCDIPIVPALMFIPNIIVVFKMFSDFYKESYSKKIN